MDIQDLRSLRRELEEAGIQFVRENEPGVGPRIGVILARSSDDQWIAIGPSDVGPDVREVIQQVLEAVAQGRI